MASIADRAAITAVAKGDRPEIVRYEGKLLTHIFMTRPVKGADGKYEKRQPTGEVALVYRICPVLADGSQTTSGAIWLWLEEPRPAKAAPALSPALLRSFADSLPALAKGMADLDAEAVAEGDWSARPTTEVVAPAPALKGLAARAARDAAAADGAKSVALPPIDAMGSDLPF